MRAYLADDVRLHDHVRIDEEKYAARCLADASVPRTCGTACSLKIDDSTTELPLNECQILCAAIIDNDDFRSGWVGRGNRLKAMTEFVSSVQDRYDYRDRGHGYGGDRSC